MVTYSLDEGLVRRLEDWLKEREKSSLPTTRSAVIEAALAEYLDRQEDGGRGRRTTRMVG